MAFNIQSQTGVPLKNWPNTDGTSSLAVDIGYQLGTTQVLALSATAQSSSAFGIVGGDPLAVRVIGSSAFYLAVGTTPTATSAAAYFGVNTAGQLIHVPGGQKISVLQAGSGGNVWLTSVT